MAIRFFVRGGTKQAYLGPDLSEYQKQYNRKIAVDNNLLLSWLEPNANISITVVQMKDWYDQNKVLYQFEPTSLQKFGMVFETRFTRYMSSVLTLDFGTLRNDSNKTVISEVTKRFKYSLTLAILPMIITFFFAKFLAVLWPISNINGKITY